MLAFPLPPKVIWTPKIPKRLRIWRLSKVKLTKGYNSLKAYAMFSTKRLLKIKNRAWILKKG